jgi:hypothetical protein
VSEVTSRPARCEDFDTVLADLSDITSAEYRRLDVDPAVAAQFAKLLLTSQPVYTFADADGPLCILGTRPEGQRLYTWFFATKRFFDLKEKTVFRFRKLLQQIVDDNPGFTLHSRTNTRTPEARRWFRLLGFELFADEGDYLHFRLV